MSFGDAATWAGVVVAIAFGLYGAIKGRAGQRAAEESNRIAREALEQAKQHRARPWLVLEPDSFLSDEGAGWGRLRNSGDGDALNVSIVAVGAVLDREIKGQVIPSKERLGFHASEAMPDSYLEITFVHPQSQMQELETVRLYLRR